MTDLILSILEKSSNALPINQCKHCLTKPSVYKKAPAYQTVRDLNGVVLCARFHAVHTRLLNKSDWPIIMNDSY